MSRYTKPFLTPAQQVDLLVSRGMVITERAKAEQCLARIGYYRLSAYWYPFRVSEEVILPDGNRVRAVRDNLRDETTFSVVHDLYVFDKQLRLIVLDALERVEVGIRTQIALTLGARDPWAYRKPKQLHGHFSKKRDENGDTRHEVWLRRFDQNFVRSKEDFAKHFQTTYPKDHPPLWIAVELWDFGSLSHFYGGMLRDDQNLIAQQMNVPDGETLKGWIRCLNDVRNLCAHHSRLFNRPLVNHPKLPDVGGVLTDFDHIREAGHSRRRLYMALLILRHLLRTINPTTAWKERLIVHIGTLPVNNRVTLESAGFPENWTTLPAWTNPD